MKWARIQPSDARDLDSSAPDSSELDSGALDSRDRDARPLSMIDAPSPDMRAAFAPDFGQRVLLTVDTEEEFNWNGPFTRESHGLSHVCAIPKFQAFCENIGAHPVYLVDWPIANDPAAIEVIGDAVQRGKADIGAQLHPWVNPPFEESLCPHNSFAGNLPRDLEKAKFMALRDQIENAFGKPPLIYRAGRYGLGPHSADILKKGGIKIDTSVRPLFDYSEQGGPDFSDHPLAPYWADKARELLEAPMTVVHWGLLRQMGQRLQKTGNQRPPMLGVLSKLRLLERIALTPEGVSTKEALRALGLTLEAQMPLTVLSFHSPSLVPGFTPYTRSEDDVEALYDWFSQIYARLFKAGVKSVRVDEVIAATLR